MRTRTRFAATPDPLEERCRRGTDQAAATGQFGVWLRRGTDSWYFGKIVAARGASRFLTYLTLDVPAGNDYRAVVAYRPTAGSGAWSSWGTSPGSFTVTAR